MSMPFNRRTLLAGGAATAAGIVGASALGLDLSGIGWVIAGGESGPGHRPVHPAWVAAIRDLCAAQNVPFFFKQWGGRTPKAGGRELEGRVWDELPELTGVSEA